MPDKAKSNIYKDVYEENLYIAGRIKHRSREGYSFTSPPKRSKGPLIVAFLSAMSMAVAYSLFISFKQINNHNVSLLNNTRPLEEISPPLSAAPTKPGEPSLSNLPVKLPSQSKSSNLADLDEAIYSLYSGSKIVVSPEQHDLEALQGYKAFAKNQFSLAKLFGLGVRTIVIDPGHGGRDPGAVGKAGTYEKDIALAIAKQLRNRLELHEQYKVLMTRDADVSMPLNKRVEFANKHHADLFISIHINYFPSEKVNFVETFYFGPTADSKIASLAERENADSHYVYAEFKDMIQKIGDTMKFQESKELAASVQHSLYEEIRQINASATNHGIKPAPFVVLLGLNAPSILTEVTSLNNNAEEKRLNSPAYRDKIAKFLEKGIVNYLNKKATLGEKGNGPKKEKLAQN